MSSELVLDYQVGKEFHYLEIQTNTRNGMLPTPPSSPLASLQAKVISRTVTPSASDSLLGAIGFKLENGGMSLVVFF